ncbi:hypothetical protein [Streptomyces albireticuli]|uniref:hypothetical protein n=1 Tax=Streptomyces albireticuli TaxID=1940 RepID=UPI0036A01E91
MSDTTPNSETSQPVPAAVDADAIRAEVEREYAVKLAKAEFKAQAAQEGASVSEEFMEYLDGSKLLGEDGRPCPETIARTLEPFKPKRPKLPQLMGAGYYRGSSAPSAPRVSLDVRKR